MTVIRSVPVLLALACSAPAVWAEQAGEAPAAPQAAIEEATAALPEMQRIEQAWAEGDFVFVREGLKRHAEETPSAFVAYRYGRVLLEGRGGPRDIGGAMQWLEQAVAENQIDAAVLLARVYLSAMPDGPARDPKRAVQLFRLAATRGNSEAQYYLGLLYGEGVGVSQDRVEAFTWQLAAAEQGHVEAQFELSRAYARGLGTEENPSEALRWMQAAASVGHSEAQFYLAYALDSGQGVPRDRAAAVKWLLRSAEAGFLQAQVALGKKYLKGDGLEPNPAEAQRWLEQAAAANHVGAQLALGLAYLGQHGLAANPARAWQLLSLASGEGMAEASFALAGLAEQGGDPDQALSLYRRAVEQGSAEAELHLGRQAAAGALEGKLAPHRMVPWVAAAMAAQDMAAQEWMQTQAAAGLRPAQTALGQWLLAQDRGAEAAPLLQAAAEAGDPEAQLALGQMFIQGNGVEQDYVQAHQWLNIAATSGSEEAVKMREVVSALMTPEQVATAQTAARAFFEAAPAPASTSQVAPSAEASR